ncbi:NAD(P)/FAD-dependent oxidoreductase [Deinococcus cavernae]|uniref:NAD(P)/FAD-dependent oxidoreductase n=1 Tax=Deinococcus cavernae TaxID=2320857 RepID=A0A418V9R1_9DEIO|nr:NAD(P)/FAD-dependent oxidoreductase [Deinococcus cavernae]RJF72786.1 NAD(P)/FAD-dependent oxidoreductase [Deinococcus cavernae]
MAHFDAVIVGAGPAGLSAALVLGGGRRKVLLLDGGPGRNVRAVAAHGVFTRDCTPPADLKRLGLADLAPYDVTVISSVAREIKPAAGGFTLQVEQAWYFARRVLFATGVRDVLPGIPGLRERWGKLVHHCPYCDGWPNRQARLAVLGSHQEGHHLALSVRAWSDHVTLLTDGPDELTPEQRADLRKLDIDLVDTKIRRFTGTQTLTAHFENRAACTFDALFLNPTQTQNSTLPAGLGCELNDKSRVVVNENGMTSVRGVWAAGDMTGAAQYVVSAAASGHTAAVSLNTTLIHENVRAQGAAFHESPDESAGVGEA